MTLGEKIKFYRSHRGLTQKMLGDMTGIHEVSIRKYELNKIVPKKDQLEKIAHVLGVSPNEFLDIQMSTDGDVLPLLFAIDENVGINITSKDAENYCIEFNERLLNYFLRDWQSIKQQVELGVISQEDYDLWKKLRSSYIKKI